MSKCFLEPRYANLTNCGQWRFINDEISTRLGQRDFIVPETTLNLKATYARLKLTANLSYRSANLLKL